MATAKHVHKLKKHKYTNGTRIFFCVLTDCHYKVEVPLALGKETICHICNNPFIINEYTLKLTKPHCSDCGKREVKGLDGRKTYVRKQKTGILADVADNSAEDLRSRLQNATAAVLEEDI